MTFSLSIQIFNGKKSGPGQQVPKILDEIILKKECGSEELVTEIPECPLSIFDPLLSTSVTIFPMKRCVTIKANFFLRHENRRFQPLSYHKF
jgi:hypothetical protein